MAIFTESYTNIALNRDPVQEEINRCENLLKEAFNEVEYSFTILKESDGEDDEASKKSIIAKIKNLIYRFIAWVNSIIDKFKKKLADRKAKNDNENIYKKSKDFMDTASGYKKQAENMMDGINDLETNYKEKSTECIKNRAEDIKSRVNKCCDDMKKDLDDLESKYDEFRRMRFTSRRV